MINLFYQIFLGIARRNFSGKYFGRYNLPRAKNHGPDSPFVRTARIKNEKLELLTASMTDEQKELLEAYFDADSKMEDMMDFDRFRFAFHCGAQLMAELIDGKGDVLLGDCPGQ